MLDGESRIVELRLRRWASAAQLLVAIAWVTFTTAALLPSPRWFVWLLLAPMMLTIFGLVAWSALADLVNTATITIDPGWTRVVTRPIRLAGGHIVLETPVAARIAASSARLASSKERFADFLRRLPERDLRRVERELTALAPRIGL